MWAFLMFDIFTADKQINGFGIFVVDEYFFFFVRIPRSDGRESFPLLQLIKH